MGASFCLQLVSEKPNCAHLVAPTFSTHRRKNRLAFVVATSGFHPAAVGAVQVDGAVGQSGAVGVFIHVFGLSKGLEIQ
jgi:hypothetical protein